MTLYRCYFELYLEFNRQLVFVIMYHCCNYLSKYPEARMSFIEIKVSLVSGSVRVANLSTMKSAIILQPGEQAIWSPEEKEIRKQSFDIKSSIGWVNGHLRFDHITLEEFIKILERWFGVTIQIEGDHPAYGNDWRLCGEFTNATLVKVLESMSFSEGIRWNYNGETNEVKLIFEN